MTNRQINITLAATYLVAFFVVALDMFFWRVI